MNSMMLAQLMKDLQVGLMRKEFWSDSFDKDISDEGTHLIKFNYQPYNCNDIGFGLVWYGMVWYGMIWFDLIRNICLLCFI